MTVLAVVAVVMTTCHGEAEVPAVCAWGTAWPVGCVPYGTLGQPVHPSIMPWPVAPWLAPVSQPMAPNPPVGQQDFRR
jgi:hypothetical protein